MHGICTLCVCRTCSLSMSDTMPCSRVSSVWCCGSWSLKLFLKLRSASLSSWTSSACWQSTNKQTELNPLMLVYTAISAYIRCLLYHRNSILKHSAFWLIIWSAVINAQTILSHYLSISKNLLVWNLEYGLWHFKCKAISQKYWENFLTKIIFTPDTEGAGFPG